MYFLTSPLITALAGLAPSSDARTNSTDRSQLSCVVGACLPPLRYWYHCSISSSTVTPRLIAVSRSASVAATAARILVRLLMHSLTSEPHTVCLPAPRTNDSPYGLAR